MSFTIETLDLSNCSDAGRILDIQRRAYRVEADLIGFDGIPPLHEMLDELIAQPLEWIGIRVDNRIVAALAYAFDNNVLDIDRLVVDPEQFGRGLASALVTFLLDRPHIIVSTGTANVPARRLYEKHSFLEIGEVEIAPGVTVTRYERRLRHP